MCRQCYKTAAAVSEGQGPRMTQNGSGWTTGRLEACAISALKAHMSSTFDPPRIENTHKWAP